MSLLSNFQFKKIVHCKYLNAWFECNDIVISVYSHYPLDPNAKSSDTKGNTFSIRWFCIQIQRVMTVYENYDVIAFKSCIQTFTVYRIVVSSNVRQWLWNQLFAGLSGCKFILSWYVSTMYEWERSSGFVLSDFCLNFDLQVYSKNMCSHTFCNSKIQQLYCWDSPRSSYSPWFLIGPTLSDFLATVFRLSNLQFTLK